MHSFRDINGENIRFEEKSDLDLRLQEDVVTGDITGYLVLYNDHIYEVDKKVYNALKNM